MENINELSKVWLSELATRGCSSNTIDLYNRNMKEFNSYICKENKSSVANLDKVTRESIVMALGDYREREDKRTGNKVLRSGQSVMSYYTTVKSFLNWCDQSDKLTSNPIKNVKPPKVPKRVPKALSIEDCQLLLDSSRLTNNPVRDNLLVKFGLTMGLRLSEISNIKLSDFSPSINNPEHLVVLGKGNKERMIPVPDSVKSSLRDYIKKRDLLAGDEGNAYLFLSSRKYSVASLSSDGIGQVFDAVLNIAGIKQPGLRVHMTRHSFATHLLNSSSSDLMGVKELLGHSSVATTQVYLKIDPKKLAKSVNDNPLNGLI